jgi:hypothetical protein
MNHIQVFLKRELCRSTYVMEGNIFQEDNNQDGHYTPKYHVVGGDCQRMGKQGLDSACQGDQTQPKNVLAVS